MASLKKCETIFEKSKGRKYQGNVQGGSDNKRIVLNGKSDCKFRFVGFSGLADSVFIITIQTFST